MADYSKLNLFQEIGFFVSRGYVFLLLVALAFTHVHVPTYVASSWLRTCCSIALIALFLTDPFLNRHKKAFRKLSFFFLVLLVAWFITQGFFYNVGGALMAVIIGSYGAVGYATIRYGRVTTTVRYGLARPINLLTIFAPLLLAIAYYVFETKFDLETLQWIKSGVYLSFALLIQFPLGVLVRTFRYDRRKKLGNYNPGLGSIQKNNYKV
jgi:hypothetical protein